MCPPETVPIGGDMKKFVPFVLDCLFVFLIAFPFLSPQQAHAQGHVVTPSDLRNDLTGASASRQKNQAQLEGFVSSPQAQKALKSAHMDGEEIKNAIPQLSDD